jgi:hypothetical protein
MKRLLLILTSAAALWSAACGGSSSLPVLPPPTGGFTLASLNGTYAFVMSGTVATTAEASFARTGSFVANGQGAITSGVYDINTSGNVTTANAITGGSYTVNADGRGTMNLNVNAGGIASTLNFGIVLTSTSNGLVMDETSTASQASTASGNFIKQDPTSFNVSAIAGTYVFDFSGTDINGAGLSIVGDFSASGGALTSGFEDINDGGSLTNGAIGTGSFTSDPTNPGTLTTFGRGIATISGETYAFYIVDATRVRFISASTSGNMLTGDGIIRNNTIPTSASSINSSFVFLIAGSSTSGGGVTRVGRFTSSAGAISQVHMDTNNVGSFILTDITASSGSITLDPANPGRATMTFTDPSNNGTFTAVLYLNSSSSGVMQETTQTTNVGTVDIADGSILAQSGSPFSSSNVTGPYAFNWSGVISQNGNVVEEDSLGQAAVSSLSLSGAADLFQFGSTTLAPVRDLLVSGSIAFNGGDGTVDDGKRSTMSVTFPNNSPISFVVYFATPQQAFFANNTGGTTRISAGILNAQQ